MIAGQLRSLYNEARTYLIEKPHQAEFQQFYRRLADKHDVFYLFFNAGFLNWVAKSVRCIPPEINVVLLGSGLTEEEVAWIRLNIRRPFHNIALRVDDNTAWQFIFDASNHNFGWIDVDCFVLNPNLFTEMANIKDDVAVNCIWSRPEHGIDVLCTHFLFVNAQAFREVRARGIPVSPVTYEYSGSRTGRYGGYAYSKVPFRRGVELVKNLLPTDSSGRALCTQVKVPTGVPYYDTMEFYQLVMNALGYRLQQVRSLDGGRAVPGYYTDEIVHITTISLYKRIMLGEAPNTIDPMNWAMFLQADWFLLQELRMPPEMYSRLKVSVLREMQRCGIDPGGVRLQLMEYLKYMGVSDPVAERLLDT